MNFQIRANDLEIIDDFSIGGEQLHQTLREIEWVNRWLGGNMLVINSLKEGLQKVPALIRKEILHIGDIGCGGGDALRTLSKWGQKKNYNLQLTGIDANPHIVDFAEQHSKGFSNISYSHQNVFDKNLDWGQFDVVLFGLFLHHFTEEQCCTLISRAQAAGVPLIIINDLHRSPLAYRLFQVLTRILGFSDISREDGLLSIRKGFRKADFYHFFDYCKTPNFEIKWKWAFRYQAIVWMDE